MCTPKTLSVRLIRVTGETVVERNLAFKLGAIGLLVALLMLALSSIGRLVAERQARRDAVIQDVARSSSGAQQLAGPILIVPYEKTVREWRENDRGDRHLEVENQRGIRRAGALRRGL